jgi:hypothetical protein
VIERIRIMDAGNEKKLHALGQECFDYIRLDPVVSLGTYDYRTKPAAASLRFESLRKAGEEAIAVMWDYHTH